MTKQKQALFKTYVATFKALGNPDHGQYENMATDQVVRCTDLNQVIDAAKAYITEHNLGGGNWNTPIVYCCDPENVANPFYMIGVITYSLRLWSTVEWEDGCLNLGNKKPYRDYMETDQLFAVYSVPSIEKTEKGFEVSFVSRQAVFGPVHTAATEEAANEYATRVETHLMTNGNVFPNFSAKEWR